MAESTARRPDGKAVGLGGDCVPQVSESFRKLKARFSGRARLPPSRHRRSARDHPVWSLELPEPRRSSSWSMKFLGNRE